MAGSLWAARACFRAAGVGLELPYCLPAPAAAGGGRAVAAAVAAVADAAGTVDNGVERAAAAPAFATTALATGCC